MDYTKRAAFLCCTCYIVLFALSFIPPQSLFGVELKRANILSDLLFFVEDDVVEDVELVIDTEEYDVDFKDVEKQVVALDEVAPIVERSYSWSEEIGDELVDADVDSVELVSPQNSYSAPVVLLPDVVLTPIEDFDASDVSSISRFYRKLLSPDSLVRIAVLGDSFIEADIITADLREALQTQYGGCGTGFAPMDSPLTRYRSTVKTTSEGWTSHNVMQKRSTPEPYASLFAISGWVSHPRNGASTTWKATSARAHLDSCQCVKLHFLAHDDATIEVRINGGEARLFEIEGGDILRQIELSRANIRSVTMRVVSGAEGFVGYGAHFEGLKGVVVDNYSVRSNNGQAMFWTSATINALIDKNIGGYDLVILQYGLNIMQSGVNKYTAYGQQVEKMILYTQKCFPKAAILVMGVSDRSMKKDGEYQPMKEALSLSEYQREAAKKRGVCFWNTHTAMLEQGGMSGFVSNGWAAKDFTHINLSGGRQIAWALVDAISSAACDERKYMVNKVDYEPIIDSLADSSFKRVLLGK